MIEVEIKLPIKDKEKLHRDLCSLGFKTGELVKESDIYFNNDGYDLKKQDKALRIRYCIHLKKQISSCVLTYKGPKLDTISMTRKEIEMDISDFDKCLQILEGIGYKPLCPVHKVRQYYHKQSITACLDQVEALGDFLELEIIISDESKREQTLEKLKEVLEVLGYKISETTRKSYLSMLQEKEL